MANRIVSVHAGIYGMGIYAIMLPSSWFSVAHCLIMCGLMVINSDANVRVFWFCKHVAVSYYPVNMLYFALSSHVAGVNFLTPYCYYPQVAPSMSSYFGIMFLFHPQIACGMIFCSDTMLYFTI